MKEALAKEEEVAQKIEGYKEALLKYAEAKAPRSASIAAIKSLSKLEEQRKLLNQLILEDTEGHSKQQSKASAPSSSSITQPPKVSTSPSTGNDGRSASPSTRSIGEPGQPLLVIIRHGKTEHNKLGLFTGWEVRIAD